MTMEQYGYRIICGGKYEYISPDSGYMDLTSDEVYKIQQNYAGKIYIKGNQFQILDLKSNETELMDEDKKTLRVSYDMNGTEVTALCNKIFRLLQEGYVLELVRGEPELIRFKRNLLSPHTMARLIREIRRDLDQLRSSVKP